MSSLRVSLLVLGFLVSDSSFAADDKAVAKEAQEKQILLELKQREEAKLTPGGIRPPTSSENTELKEIVFKDLLVIHDKSIAKDGGAAEVVPCSAELDGETFGYIQLDEKVKAELNCVDDYAGGISLVVKGKKGKKQTEKIGEVLGDAGESLDTRTWISKKDKKITITTVSISSYQDADAEDTAPINCDKKAWLIEWDAKNQKLKRKSIAYSEKDFKFVPAAQVAAKCL
ncbi:hypothetical protein [Bdellovibrio sp. HCB2-146]|uniref:hypothetical protein n=1 Tax=Bdellovibrio sp. HCB2-146 TaxID=3394362 RepID=UPI0039BD7593